MIYAYGCAIDGKFPQAKKELDRAKSVLGKFKEDFPVLYSDLTAYEKWHDVAQEKISELEKK